MLATTIQWVNLPVKRIHKSNVKALHFATMRPLIGTQMHQVSHRIRKLKLFAAQRFSPMIWSRLP